MTSPSTFNIPSSLNVSYQSLFAGTKIPDYCGGFFESRQITEANLKLVRNKCLCLWNKDKSELPAHIVMPRATALHFLIRYPLLPCSGTLLNYIVDDEDIALFYKEPVTDEETSCALSNIDEQELAAAQEAYDPTSPFTGISGVSYNITTALHSTVAINSGNTQYIVNTR